MKASLLQPLLVWMIRHRVRGWTRLSNLLGMGPGGRGVLLRNRFGALLELDPFDYMDAYVLRDGFYESEVFEAVLEALPRDGVFWDVGAHAGHHCVTLKLRVPNATAVAFEPSVREIAKLVRSMQLNAVHVELLPLALDRNTALNVFHICQTNAGRNALQTFGSVADYQATLAQCVRADELCRDFAMPVPSVIKIDVEGAELRVLEGMQNILADPKCQRIVLEAAPAAAQAGHPIHDLLTKCGFLIRQLQRQENTGHQLVNLVADKSSY